MTVQSSTFYVVKNDTIDGQDPTTNRQQACDIGILTVGGSKTVQRRWIADINLFGAADVGRALKASDTVITAELWAEVISITGASGFTVDVNRIVRADWEYTQATWNIYKTANNWTTAGADHDGNDRTTTTPTGFSFSSPTATGYQKITGVSGLVSLTNDAITNRSGRLITRLRANDEGATDHLFVASSDPDSVSYQWARLIVTYESPQPGPALMGLSPGIM